MTGPKFIVFWHSQYDKKNLNLTVIFSSSFVKVEYCLSSVSNMMKRKLEDARRAFQEKRVDLCVSIQGVPKLCLICRKLYQPQSSKIFAAVTKLYIKINLELLKRRQEKINETER